MFLPFEQDLFNETGASAPAQPSVEQMAAAYIDAMREKQPVGPYAIVGFCFGGVVAYEMAQQLRASGEAGPLVILDSALTGTFRVPWARMKARRARRRARRLVQVTTNPVKRALGRPTSGPTELNRLWQLRNGMFADAKRRYKVSAYGGPMLLMQSEETLNDPANDITDLTFGWGKYADRLEIQRVPGGHRTHLQRPYVEAVVNAVRPFLEANGPAAQGSGAEQSAPDPAEAAA
jgi:thioesterase domain-containing protein